MTSNRAIPGAWLSVAALCALVAAVCTKMMGGLRKEQRHGDAVQAASA